MEMNIEGFINALYEKMNSGALSVSYIKPGNAPVTRWFTRDQLDDMAAFIRKCGKQYNTYINIIPGKTRLIPAIVVRAQMFRKWLVCIWIST